MDRSALFLAPLRLRVRHFLAPAHRREPVSRSGRKPARLRAFARFTVAIIAIAVVSLTIFLVLSYRSYAKIVDERFAPGYLTSRAGIYAAPRTLRAGQKYSPAALAAVLRRAGYVEDEDAGEVWNGSFSV